MTSLETLRESLPESARDLKLNLQSVLEGGSLTPAQKWGTALASALTTRHPALIAAMEEASAPHLSREEAEDARAAAALMGMNNVLYRFRHMVEKEDYSRLPARLRMNRLSKPLARKLDFELYCLAVSAQNGCATCIRSHEEVVIRGGMTPENVLDGVRIAATLAGVVVAVG